MNKKNLKISWPLFIYEFIRLKVTEALEGYNLLFTTMFPGVPGTYLIGIGRMKTWVDLGATQWFGSWNL